MQRMHPDLKVMSNGVAGKVTNQRKIRQNKICPHEKREGREAT